MNSPARNSTLHKLSDTDLLARLEKLRGTEREIQLEIINYLIELERRRLYLPRGYSSLFDFCTGHLGYSKSAAARRIRAARCIGRFPRIGGMFLSGELNLSVIALIADIVTRENIDDILRRIRGRSFREVEMLVATHRPGRVIRDRIKPVLVMRPGPVDTAGYAGESSSADAAAGENNSRHGSGPECTLHRTSTPDVGSEKSTGYEDNHSGLGVGEHIERLMRTRKHTLESAGTRARIHRFLCRRP